MNKAYSLKPKAWGEGWHTSGRHITSTNAFLAEQDEIAPEAIEEILARRATELAEVVAEEEIGERVDLLLVRLGHEIYGLETRYVDRVEPLSSGQITRVPRVPDWVAGVVNLRGRIYSVVDLLRFFGLPSLEGGGPRAGEDGHGGSTRENEGADLVFVETPDLEVALVVDEATTVASLPASRIQEASGTVRGLRPEVVRGVADHGDGITSQAGGAKNSLVVVLDLPALLSDERLIVHEEIV